MSLLSRHPPPPTASCLFSFISPTLADVCNLSLFLSQPLSPVVVREWLVGFKQKVKCTDSTISVAVVIFKGEKMCVEWTLGL